jgi:hypothetical protein
MRNKTNVAYSDFMNELQKEYEYLSGGTKYRAETALMCLELAEKVDDFTLFLDYDDTFDFVKNSLDVDADRLKDVTKMLYTVLGDLHCMASLTEKTKLELARRKANRKPWKLVPAIQTQ